MMGRRMGRRIGRRWGGEWGEWGGESGGDGEENWGDGEMIIKDTTSCETMRGGAGIKTMDGPHPLSLVAYQQSTMSEYMALGQPGGGARQYPKEIMCGTSMFLTS